MQANTFNQIRKVVYDNSGIYLADCKMQLVSARIQKRLRSLDLESYEDYLDILKKDKVGNELVEFLNVISTNTTNFFREPDHFKYYSKMIGAMRKRGQSRIRVWCAASSTGQEPYTLAMCYLEEAGGANIDFQMLATDISTQVLEAAQAGIYSKEQLSDIPGNIRYKYFTKKANNSDEYEANAAMRSLITYKRLNLSKTPYPMHGPFDIIFCRNVMIYFDQVTRQKLIDEAWRLLRPGGYLFMGHSESTNGIKNNFVRVRPALYQKR